MAIIKTLDDFSPEIKKAILIKQAEIKADKNHKMYSQRYAIGQIIKEWLLYHHKSHSTK